MDAGKKLVDFMVEVSEPLKTDFDDMNNLLERMTRKISVKVIVDQME